MAKRPQEQDRKVGVYGDDATTKVVEPNRTDTTTGTRTSDEKKGGGIPSWAIALIVVALIILAIIFLF